MKIQYSLYDSRAIYNKERASIYSVCETLKEALSDKKTMFTDAIIFKESLEKQNDGNYIVVNSQILKK